MPLSARSWEVAKIPICFENYEADDVIGTIAKQVEKQGYDVIWSPGKITDSWCRILSFMYKPSRQGNGIEI